MNKLKKKLKSLRRIIFGRTMVVVLGLGLQLYFIVSALVFFSNNLVYFTAASNILSLIAIVYIINEKTNPYFRHRYLHLRKAGIGHPYYEKAHGGVS